MTYGEIYETGRAALSEAAVEEAEIDARLLLEFVCGTDRNTLLAHGDREVTAEQEGAYRELLRKRSEHIPLQYLTGVQNFMGLDFAVNRYVLIPRQDTEILVEEAMKELHDGMEVLDLCTGTGCILISLLYYSNNCRGVGADISEEALRVAADNAGRLLGSQRDSGGSEFSSEEQEMPGKLCGTELADVGIEPLCGTDPDWQISFVRSDLFENVDGKFDMIVSNPPYIQSEIIDTLMPEVREHEPRQALDGGRDGLLFYRRILAEVSRYLRRGGMLFFEIGHDQGESVSRLMKESGLTEIQVIKDYGGLDRVVWGTLGFGD